MNTFIAHLNNRLLITGLLGIFYAYSLPVANAFEGNGGPSGPFAGSKALWQGYVGEIGKYNEIIVEVRGHPSYDEYDNGILHKYPNGITQPLRRVTFRKNGPTTLIEMAQGTYGANPSYPKNYSSLCITSGCKKDYFYGLCNFGKYTDEIKVISVKATSDKVPSVHPECFVSAPTPPPSTPCQNGESQEVSASKVIKFNFEKLGVMPSRLKTLNKAVQKLLGEGTVKAVQGAGFIAKQSSPIVVEPVVEFLPKGEVKIDHKRDCCNGKWSNAYYNTSGKVTLLTLGAKAKVKLPIPQFPALAVVGSREVSAEASFQGKPQSKCSANNSTSRSSIKGEAIVGLKFESKLGLGDSAGIVSGQGVMKATVAYPLPVSVSVDTANLVQGVTVGAAKTRIALYAEIGFESCMLDGGFCYYTKSLPLMDTTYDLLW